MGPTTRGAASRAGEGRGGPSERAGAGSSAHSASATAAPTLLGQGAGRLLDLADLGLQGRPDGGLEGPLGLQRVGVVLDLEGADRDALAVLALPEVDRADGVAVGLDADEELLLDLRRLLQLLV